MVSVDSVDPGVAAIVAAPAPGPPGPRLRLRNHSLDSQIREVNPVFETFSRVSNFTLANHTEGFRDGTQEDGANRGHRPPTAREGFRSRDGDFSPDLDPAWVARVRLGPGRWYGGSARDLPWREDRDPLPDPRLRDDAGADDGRGRDPVFRPVPGPVPDRRQAWPRPTRPMSSRPGRAWATTEGPAAPGGGPRRHGRARGGLPVRSRRDPGPARRRPLHRRRRSSPSPSIAPPRSSRPTPSASWPAGSPGART